MCAIGLFLLAALLTYDCLFFEKVALSHSKVKHKLKNHILLLICIQDYEVFSLAL